MSDLHEVEQERDEALAKLVLAEGQHLAAREYVLRADETIAGLRSVIERLRSGVRYLECPCCGEEGAFPTLYEDGDPTICGCGGQVSADGENAYIVICSEEDCPKCSTPEMISGGTPPPEHKEMSP